jgi:RNA polymerase sigma factor (sigma-70 family)
MKHLIRHVRQATGTGPAGGDAELLAAFARDRDHAAFAALVERHGPMVYAACRRLLRDPNDLDDAFQAVFLVLIRKAGTVRGAQLAGWLYGVALRTAKAARKLAARRKRLDEEYRAQARQVAEVPPDPVEADDLRAVLDRELGHLTASARSAIILCDLEGRTRKEAAAELGWPEGTLATRLARARQVLATRLARIGINLSVPTLVTALARQAGAAVPPALKESVARLATGTGAARATVIGIADRVSSRLGGYRLLAAGMGAALALGAATAGLLLTGKEVPPTPPPRGFPHHRVPPPPEVAIAPVPRVVDGHWVVATTPERTVAVRDEDGMIRDPAPVRAIHGAVRSPDGTRWLRIMTHLRLPDQLVVEEAGRRSWHQVFGAEPRYAGPSWSPDGKRVICVSENPVGSGRWVVVCYTPGGSLMTLLTRDITEPVSMPRFHPDGCRFAFRKEVGRGPNGRLLYDLILRDGGMSETLAEKAEVVDYAFCPGGGVVAMSIAGRGLVLRDLKARTESLIRLREMKLDPDLDFGQLQGRPDGNVLAFRPVFVRGTRFAGGGLTLVQSPREVRDLDRVGFVRFGERPLIVTYPLAPEFQLNHWVSPPPDPPVLAN